MDIDYVLKRMREDKVFAIIYPICEIVGENADEIAAKIRAKAKFLNESPETVAADTKAKMMRGLQAISGTA